MKHLLIALSGAADQPAPPKEDKTPLELAKVPNLNHFAKVGKAGLVKLMSERLEPSSDVAFLNLLGYDADKAYTGRGPIEAANLNLKLDTNEIAFCMNLITEADSAMADPTSGQISTKEAKALVNFLNKKVANDFVRFYAGAGYCHVAVIKDSHGFEALSAKTVAPDHIVGEKLEEHFPKGPGEELLKKLMYDTRLLLKDHEINQVRVDLMENPANMIWLWGQGRWPQIQPFREKFGLGGVVISSMEYAKGIARLAGLGVIDPGVSFFEEEGDHEKIARLMCDALHANDFVCVHLNGCDEASRLGDARAKISALEATDFFILSEARRYLEEHRDTRLVAATGFVAPWNLRRHLKDASPFVLAGAKVPADDIEKFSEVSANASGWKVKNGSELISQLLVRQ